MGWNIPMQPMRVCFITYNALRLSILLLSHRYEWQGKIQEDSEVLLVSGK